MYTTESNQYDFPESFLDEIYEGFSEGVATVNAQDPCCEVMEETTDQPSMYVCFGMISFQLTCTSKHFTKTDPVPVKIAKEGRVSSVIGADQFGNVDEVAVKVMEAIWADGDLHCQLYCVANPQFDTGSPVTKSEQQQILYVNIFGLAAIGEDLGKYLQHCNVYLQEPRHCDRNVPYRNPHCLFMAEGETIMTADFDRHVLPTPVVEEYTRSLDMLGQFENDGSLVEKEGPTCLLTFLHKHQKQALAFMLKREQGWVLDGAMPDLWRLETGTDGCTQFVSNISGDAQRQPPQDFRGGIIADPMGFGKSLTMIALVAHDKAGVVGSHAPVVLGPNRTTLLVVPPSLVQTWEDQLERHVCDGALTWRRHQGKNQLRDPNQVHNYDIIIVTFQIIMAAYKKHKNEDNLLFTTSWHRIILDEAHIIRDGSRVTTKAICALKARSRWAVSGTPIQNRVNDIASLFRFIRVYPYSDSAVFDKEITQPWRNGMEAQAIGRLKAVFDCVALRRPKSTLQLPSRTDQIHYLTFRPEERALYEQVSQTNMSAVEEGLSDGRRNVSLSVLSWINALRRVCNLSTTIPNSCDEATPISTPESDWNEVTAQKMLKQIAAIGGLACIECALALDTQGDANTNGVDGPPARLTACSRLLCGACWTRLFPHICGHMPCCPDSSIQDPLLNVDANQRSASWDTSIEAPSKVQALIKDVKDTEERCVVFSYFTSMLDVIEQSLRVERIAFRRVDGTVPARGRELAMAEFRSNSQIKVIMVTISCGAVGLDLTAATRAYLMEPQWNPTSEEQALARIHRIGQTKPVTTIRYLMKDTIEEHFVVKVQERKKYLEKVLLEQTKLSPADIERSRVLLRPLIK